MTVITELGTFNALRCTLLETDYIHSAIGALLGHENFGSISLLNSLTLTRWSP